MIAARVIARRSPPGRVARRCGPSLVAALLGTLAVPTYAAVAPVLAGRLPGRARAAFPAVARPAASSRRTCREGATMLAIGPSMANILEFYGHRRAYGLSVSPNPPAPQSDLPGRRQPRPLAAPRRHPVHRLGRVLGAQERALRAAAAELRLALPRPCRLHVQHARPGEATARVARVPLIIVYAVRP